MSIKPLHLVGLLILTWIEPRNLVEIEAPTFWLLSWPTSVCSATRRPHHSPSGPYQVTSCCGHKLATNSLLGVGSKMSSFTWTMLPGSEECGGRPFTSVAASHHWMVYWPTQGDSRSQQTAKISKYRPVHCVLSGGWRKEGNFTMIWNWGYPLLQGPWLIVFVNILGKSTS